ncbi:tripartite tricarboxylate transporter TctB family protein [Hansschlegelia beijingensis]|uniref:Zn-dependent protease n=1 Tax=Hansschlegelia beijingensis TaxID=1133344 RepID=A0A7W6CZ29_9HYPH|nr:tripartite tricarboxylate transporter TctB family protein [Hansschlegelia beijingensis]MBB3973688.1 Zn-dependent protease [Hansschlegelia beijingensis]
MQIDTRELACGGLFVAFAAAFAYGTVDLPLGSALRMGPGYFPLMLAIILGVLGLVIIFKGLGRAPSPIGGVPWRGLLFILAGPIVFGLTVRGLGLAAAIALVAAIATLASARAGIRLMLLLTLSLTVFCVIVFSYGLGLPYALVGPWLAPFLPGR